MICFAIIAETIYNRSHLIEQASDLSNCWLKRMQTDNVGEFERDFYIFPSKPIMHQVFTNDTISEVEYTDLFQWLERLEEISDFKIETVGKNQYRFWGFKAAFRKIDVVFTIATAIQLIIGTIIWAYGDLVTK